MKANRKFSARAAALTALLILPIVTVYNGCGSGLKPINLKDFDNSHSERSSGGTTVGNPKLSRALALVGSSNDQVETVFCMAQAILIPEGSAAIGASGADGADGADGLDGAFAADSLDSTVMAAAYSPEIPDVSSLRPERIERSTFQRTYYRVDTSSYAETFRRLFDPFMVEISEVATTFGEIEAEAGTYEGAELHLTPSCGDGWSVQVRNPNGVFYSKELVTLSFRGSRQISDPDELIQLEVSSLVDDLINIQSANEIKARLEAAPAQF